MILVQIFAGVMYANLIEYFVHRDLFHGLGKSGSSIFAFHLREHHLIARRNEFIDNRVSRNELIGLPLLILLHFPFLFFIPFFFYTITFYSVLFVVVHNVLHHHPQFAKQYFWWHWNHHMRNQNKSWGVVLPLADIILGTLEDNRIRSRSKKNENR